MELNNVAILSTVLNWDLYKKSSQYFPSNMTKYVIDGRNGMHGIHSIYYMMYKFKHISVDWLIMADEDVLFINTEAVNNTIQYMQEHDYIVCGVRDGGCIDIRKFNPYAINTFFSVVNLKRLKEIWNKKEIKENQYIHDNEFLNLDELQNLKKDYDSKSLYEPYYCFYFWLKRRGEKILYLDATTPLKDDNITTLVLNPRGEEILFHTWYARSYGENAKHTQRIDAVFNTLNYSANKYIEPIIWKDHTYATKRIIKKLKNKVSQKLKKILVK